MNWIKPVMLFVILFGSCAHKKGLRKKYIEGKKPDIIEKTISYEKENTNKNSNEITSSNDRIYKKKELKYYEDVPQILNYWLFIHKGEIYGESHQPINYPGRMRVSYTKKNSNGNVIVYLENIYIPHVLWRMELPREDGEHMVKAFRVK